MNMRMIRRKVTKRMMRMEEDGGDEDEYKEDDEEDDEEGDKEEEDGGDVGDVGDEHDDQEESDEEDEVDSKRMMKRIKRMMRMEMKRRRMGVTLVMLTNFCEVDSSSKMDGKAPMTSPNRAVFVAILPKSSFFSSRLKESFLPPQRLESE